MERSATYRPRSLRARRNIVESMVSTALTRARLLEASAATKALWEAFRVESGREHLDMGKLPWLDADSAQKWSSRRTFEEIERSVDA